MRAGTREAGGSSRRPSAIPPPAALPGGDIVGKVWQSLLEGGANTKGKKQRHKDGERSRSGKGGLGEGRKTFGARRIERARHVLLPSLATTEPMRLGV